MVYYIIQSSFIHMVAIDMGGCRSFCRGLKPRDHSSNIFLLRLDDIVLTFCCYFMSMLCVLFM